MLGIEQYEKFIESCKEPVDIDKAREALTKLLNGTYSLSVPVRINDPDIIISRALDELERLRTELQQGVGATYD